MTIEFLYMEEIYEFLQIMVLGCVLSLPVCWAVESFKSLGIKQGWFYCILSMVISALFGFGFAETFTEMNTFESAWLSVCLWLGSQGFYEKLKHSDGFIGKAFVSLSERFGIMEGIEIEGVEVETEGESELPVEDDPVQEEPKEDTGSDINVPTIQEEGTTEENSVPETEVKVEIPEAEERDYSKNQLKVLVSDLRVRKEPNGTVLGYAKKNGYYSFSELVEENGIEWYNIGDCWVGDSGDNDVTVCPAGCVMQYPVNYVALSTNFSKSHPAIDFGWHSKHGGANQPIIAPCDMKVVEVGESDVVGKKIRAHATYEGKKYTFRFIHLSKTSVSKGDLVQGGEVIGNMGNTGSSSNGSHLHFDIWEGHTGDLSGSSDRYEKSVNALEICRLVEGQTVGDETDKKYKIKRA